MLKSDLVFSMPAQIPLVLPLLSRTFYQLINANYHVNYQALLDPTVWW